MPQLKLPFVPEDETTKEVKHYDNNIKAALSQKGLTPEEVEIEYALFMGGEGTVLTEQDKQGILLEMQYDDG